MGLDIRERQKISAKFVGENGLNSCKSLLIFDEKSKEARLYLTRFKGKKWEEFKAYIDRRIIPALREMVEVTLGNPRIPQDWTNNNAGMVVLKNQL